ncbi:Oidioi.mRNA.OKI2018_I69.XSR.g13883.t1.cds [Oikopleura dioica]|uniref:Oidioi.mRNA.OKI2018_I69.XSR.g13883.t1.cds n=1 Tax=Oikopleura dioica TaxID=34765 RepID=A0ABN7SF95_OIKDI|nr:Oidioi.mRNA.OKI2018_I69.XSR.g13883.t1.cds [Oikopleura dioica]
MNFDEIFQVSKKDELPGIDDWIYKLADNSEESEIDDSLLVEFLNSGVINGTVLGLYALAVVVGFLLVVFAAVGAFALLKGLCEACIKKAEVVPV